MENNEAQDDNTALPQVERVFSSVDMTTCILENILLPDLVGLRSWGFFNSVICNDVFAKNYPHADQITGIFLDQVNLFSLPSPLPILAGERLPTLDYLLNAIPGTVRIRVLQESNGLMLCKATTPSETYLLVTNPTLKTRKTISPIGIPANPENVFFAFAYDPNMSPFYYIVGRFEGYHVYSSQTKKWTESSVRVSPNYHRTPFYWYGSVNWRSINCVESMPYEFLDNPVSRKLFPCNLEDICYMGECDYHFHLVQSAVNLCVIYELDPSTRRWKIVHYLYPEGLQNRFKDILGRDSRLNLTVLKIFVSNSIYSNYNVFQHQNYIVKAYFMSGKSKILSEGCVCLKSWKMHCKEIFSR